MGRLRPKALSAVPLSFTLIELLVTMGIIVLLVAISVPALQAVRRGSEVRETAAFLARLGLALESYCRDFGDYPPSSPSGLGLRSNKVNDGSECLVRCLLTREKNGPYLELRDEELGNTDADALLPRQNPTNALLQSDALLEALDSWGNPIAYIHNADYAREARVLLASGPATLRARRSAVTQQFQALTKFQLLSAGPDGLSGTEDDVTATGP